jgi:hypothetical protein
MVDERGEKMQMVEEGRKRKYEITTGSRAEKEIWWKKAALLFSRREHHILGL